jgi:hypothetical protein
MKKMSKKSRGILLIILSLVVLFGLTMPLMARETSVPKTDPLHTCCGGHYHGDLRDYNFVPMFVDPDTGLEWVGVDSRECEHGMWGLDVLFVFEGEYKWLCRGFKVAEYILLCDEQEEKYYGIAPLATMTNCPRCNNNTTISTSSSGPQARVAQRNCIHIGLWGVDIQYQQHHFVSSICAVTTCRAYMGTHSWTTFIWRCYGLLQ